MRPAARPERGDDDDPLAVDQLRLLLVGELDLVAAGRHVNRVALAGTLTIGPASRTGPRRPSAASRRPPSAAGGRRSGVLQAWPDWPVNACQRERSGAAGRRPSASSAPRSRGRDRSGRRRSARRSPAPPPGWRVRLKIHSETGWSRPERVRELERVDVAPAPALGVGAEALLEVVERAAQRLQHELVPGAADQLLVALIPEREQVGVPAPRRGDVGDEAVVGPVEVALGEVAVADRRAGELARQPQQEGLVDRARDGLAGSSVRSQLFSRSIALISRWLGRLQAGEPVDDLVPGDRVEVGLHAAEALQVVLLASRRAAARSARRGSRPASRW